MAAYSMDLRERVLADSDAGMPTKQVAEKYGVSRTWVRSLKQRRRETGSIAPRVSTGRPRKIDRGKLATLVEQCPDATLVELRDRLGVDCSPTAIWMVLDALRITFKKNATSRRARPTGRRRETRVLENAASRARPAPTCFHRRNVGENEHDAFVWSRARAVGGWSALFRMATGKRRRCLPRWTTPAYVAR